jgi:hypothetical protein
MKSSKSNEEAVSLDKKVPLNRGPRLIVECTEDYKATVWEQAQARGFDNIKSYLVHLLNKDRDILNGYLKEKSPKK